MRLKSVAALLLPLLLVGAGCGSGASEDLPSSPESVPTLASAPASDGAGTGEASPGATGTTGTDDLATGHARHVIRSSGVTATVDYETRKPNDPWTATGDKPLRVEVKVSQPRKKVYLTRVTLRFSVDDGTGNIPGPDPIVDAASNISPGYLVAPPYSYVQAFALPIVDPSTARMTIDVKLELVSLVDAKSKDYTKQTVTDRIATTVQS